MFATILLTIAHLIAIVAGILLIFVTLESTIHTLIVPRAISSPLIRWYYTLLIRIFRLRIKLARRNTYKLRDRVMSLYAPVSLFLLPFAWLTLVMFGYALVYWGLAYGNPWQSLILSGSSLLTLGSIVIPTDNYIISLLMFTEAMMGMVLVALLIAYLPTMYSAFAERERLVMKLATPAGVPPSPVTMIIRLYHLGDLSRDLRSIWGNWRDWFTSIDESHTTYAPLVFFRSSKPEQSWITSAGVVLDTAALVNALVDVPHDTRADLCIRSGYVALRDIADFFDIAYDPDPRPDAPISISRQEFDAVCDELEAEGIPLRADRGQAWRDFAGWRVNYDTVLLQLAALTMAPYAMWVSDRSMPNLPPRNLVHPR